MNDFETLNLPLVIDLDGTLIRTNSLDETFLDALRRNPLDVWKLPITLVAGRAVLKSFLAGKSRLDVETWPVQIDFLNYVTTQFKAGRKIVLATAADRKIGEAIAACFPIISEVIASDGSRNLKGEAKAKHLRDRFPGGFIYAGDSRRTSRFGGKARAASSLAPQAVFSIASAASRNRSPSFLQGVTLPMFSDAACGCINGPKMHFCSCRLCLEERRRT